MDPLYTKYDDTTGEVLAELYPWHLLAIVAGVAVALFMFAISI